MTAPLDFGDVADLVRVHYGNTVATPFGILTKYEDTEQVSTFIQPTDQPWVRLQVDTTGGRYQTVGRTRFRVFGLLLAEVFTPPSQGPDAGERIAGQIAGTLLAADPTSPVTYRGPAGSPDVTVRRLARQGAWLRRQVSLPFEYECA